MTPQKVYTLRTSEAVVRLVVAAGGSQEEPVGDLNIHDLGCMHCVGGSIDLMSLAAAGVETVTFPSLTVPTRSLTNLEKSQAEGRAEAVKLYREMSS